MWRCAVLAFAFFVFGARSAGAAPEKAIVLTGIAPSAASGGTVVALSGKNFGRKKGSVYFAATPAAILAWRNEAIQAVVPATLASGAVPVRVEVKSRTSNTLAFQVAGDVWYPVSATGMAGRFHHSAVWTGSEMLIFGGNPNTGPIFYGADNGGLADGGRYNPALDEWLPISTAGGPVRRLRHAAVWTGSVMIVWGGYNGLELNSGGRYNPASDSWAATTLSGAPLGRHELTAVWSGSQMIVWGGYDNTATFTFATTGPRDGGRYDPLTDTWQPTSLTGAPTARYEHSAVWTGSRMIVWGGDDFLAFRNDGFAYDPGGDSWSPIATAGAPEGRHAHSAVWTGSSMLVWGGETNRSFPTPVSTGSQYDPGTDTWDDTSLTGAPVARSYQRHVWTGTELIVWGGTDSGGITAGFVFHPLASGGRYNPSLDIWAPLSAVNAPVARYLHSAVWSGLDMLVWGGFEGTNVLNGGRRYRP
jgi:N-acetylneuraminic acid mutarotase